MITIPMMLVDCPVCDGHGEHVARTGRDPQTDVNYPCLFCAEDGAVTLAVALAEIAAAAEFDAWCGREPAPFYTDIRLLDPTEDRPF
jgi:hypothetical protein